MTKKEDDELYQKATQSYAEIAKAIHNLVDGELLELHRKANEAEAKLAELTKRSEEWEESHKQEDEDIDVTPEDVSEGTITLVEEDHLDTMPEGVSVSYEGKDPRETMNLAFKDLFIAHRRRRRAV